MVCPLSLPSDVHPAVLGFSKRAIVSLNVGNVRVDPSVKVSTVAGTVKLRKFWSYRLPFGKSLVSFCVSACACVHLLSAAVHDATQCHRQASAF